MKNIHGNNSEIQTIESDTVQPLEIYECKMCDFKTTHHPGLKVMWQKEMEIQKIILLSSAFSSKKKLKQLIDEAVL